jgi:AP-2 complex subunit alpha
MIESNIEMFKSKSLANQTSMKSTTSAPANNNNMNFASTSQKPATTTTASSLLDEDLLGGGGTVVNLKANALYGLAQSKLAPDGSSLPIPDPIRTNYANYTEFKSLITSTTGVLLNNDKLQIDYKSEFQGNQGKIAMQFVSKNGQPLTNIAMQIVNAPHIQFNITPVKYDDNPKVLIQATLISPSAAIPHLQLIYVQGDQKTGVELAFPCTANKFTVSVDMPIANFKKFWDEYTASSNPNYFRIDNFIKNPAPPNVPITDVLKKVGALLNNGLGLKANGLPDMNNLKEVYAAAQYTFKPENAANPVNLPFMVQVEGFTENTSFLRFSLRGAGSAEVIKAFYQIIMTYLGA